MKDRVAALLLAALVAVVLHAPPAHADGDPASDYLLNQKIFFPIEAKFPAEQRARLTALVDAANRAGFKLRIALIGSSYDLGSVPSLYLKPRAYARFLGAELAFAYKQRLLVIMPNGFGFNWPHHRTADADAILDEIPIKPGRAGFLATVEIAVKRLIAAAATAAAIVLSVGAAFLLRRRRRPQPRP
jgi:hypothetical protein